MKTKKSITKLVAVLIIIIFSFITTNSGAQNYTKNVKEHCMMKDGKMMHCKEGKTIFMEKDMTMANCAKCMNNGEYLMKNGKKMMLKDDEYIDLKGKIDKCEMVQKTDKRKKRK